MNAQNIIEGEQEERVANLNRILRFSGELTCALGGSKERFPVDSLRDASDKYCMARDRSGMGASEWPPAKVFNNGKQVAKISYNGRVWDMEGNPVNIGDQGVIESAKTIVETMTMAAPEISTGGNLPPIGNDAWEGDGDGSERQRLLDTWRDNPDALVDLIAPEDREGQNDGGGKLTMTEPESGNEIDEFKFSSPDIANEAVDWALHTINPGME